MSKLDDIKLIKKYDGSDMLKTIESFPEQCARAVEIGRAFKLPDATTGRYEHIVFTGMGGSAIGADIIRSYTGGEASVPVFVNRNYTLPQFVNDKSLVIASSYSGNTEETLAAYQDARAKRAGIIVVTSGGDIERCAKTDGFPVLKIPAGLAPRCALGYSLFPALILLSKVGILKDKSGEIAEAIKVMEGLRDKSLRHNVPAKDNTAKTIAAALYQKYPVIYAGQDHIDSVATRWRGQLAENSKTLSSAHLFPEMNHNEIVGWENPKALLKDFIVVMLRDCGDNMRTATRMDITGKMISGKKIAVLEATSCGSGLLARIFSLVYTGDFVSFYLAMLNECDPTPVESIAYLKKELAGV